MLRVLDSNFELFILTFWQSDVARNKMSAFKTTAKLEEKSTHSTPTTHPRFVFIIKYDLCTKIF